MGIPLDYITHTDNKNIFFIKYVKGHPFVYLEKKIEMEWTEYFSISHPTFTRKKSGITVLGDPSPIIFLNFAIKSPQKNRKSKIKKRSSNNNFYCLKRI